MRDSPAPHRAPMLNLMRAQSATTESPGAEERAVTVRACRSALLLVDMQNDFVRPGGALYVPQAQETIRAIESLLALARKSGMRRVFTQDTHRQGDEEWRVWPPHAERGSWGWQIVPELAPEARETVIEKLRYDAFYGTELDHLLRSWGVRSLIICGTLANICVHYTAASAALRWYEVVIPRDAVSSLEPFDLEASLRQTELVLGGRVTSAGSVHVV